MTTNEKWDLLKKYLKSKEEGVLVSIRTAAMDGETSNMVALGSELSTILAILSKAESLDKGKKLDIPSRGTPPRHNY